MVRHLASGGMAEIYQVAHRKLGRLLAAKVLHSRLASDPMLVDRMRVEAQVLGRMRHANIVAILGFGTTSDQRPFVVMEQLIGHTLEQELRTNGHLPISESVSLALQLLSALCATHALGIVHRDIKPSNLFLSTTPSGERTLKVLDFGIAKESKTERGEAIKQLALCREHVGLVVVQVSPVEASLVIDGAELLGRKTAPRELWLPLGEHVVQARANGQISPAKTITVEIGNDQRARIGYSRRGSTNHGSVSRCWACGNEAHFGRARFRDQIGAVDEDDRTHHRERVDGCSARDRDRSVVLVSSC